MFAVGDVIEAVATSEDLEFGLFLDEIVHVIQRLGGIEVFRAVCEVARPVGEFVGGGPGEEAGDGGDGDGGRGEFYKSTLVHGEIENILFGFAGGVIVHPPC